MTPADHAAAVQALIDQLAPMVCDASATVPHTVILAALIGMYRATALQFPCCTNACARACMLVGNELALHQANQQPSLGASIH